MVNLAKSSPRRQLTRLRFSPSICIDSIFAEAFYGYRPKDLVISLLFFRLHIFS